MLPAFFTCGTAPGVHPANARPPLPAAVVCWSYSERPKLNDAHVPVPMSAFGGKRTSAGRSDTRRRQFAMRSEASR
jgi:hypothetical protein